MLDELLQAIVTHPQEEDRYAVLADWLEERRRPAAAAPAAAGDVGLAPALASRQGRLATWPPELLK